MSTLSGGQALAAALAAHSVDLVFGIPGTHNLGMFAALPEHGITSIVTRHEQGAGFAADGYARSTGRVGVVLTTTGPAILNAATAAAQAYSDSIPMLLISPGMALDHPGLGNGTLHELKNQTGALDAIVGYSHRVGSVAEIPVAVAQAFARLRSGRPRPVHLEIPLDLLDATADVEVVSPIRVPAAPPAPASVGLAVGRLSAARSPMIIAGGGASRATVPLRALARRLGAPVVTTANGKGVLDEDDPMSVGAGVQHRAVLDLVEESDVVLAVGTELAPSDWWIGLPPMAAKLVRVDVDPAAIVANVIPAVAVVADATITLEEILRGLGVTDRPSHDSVSRAARWRERLTTEAAAAGAVWHDLAAGLTEALPPGAVIAADQAMACYYGTMSPVRLHRPRSFLFPSGGGTLGYGLPAGIGAKLAMPETPVVVVHGDGGLMFTVAELATAAQQRLPLPVIVVDNGGYGEIRAEMRDRGDPVTSVDLGHPDFRGLAESLGCHGVRARTRSEIAEAVTRAFDADRPTVIHVVETVTD